MPNLSLAACALAILAPATAQDNQLQPRPLAVSTPTAGVHKKEKLVCETQGSTGSRLGRKKVCLTAEQWAEQRLLDRRDVERIQANRYKGNQ